MKKFSILFLMCIYQLSFAQSPIDINIDSERNVDNQTNKPSIQLAQTKDNYKSYETHLPDEMKPWFNWYKDRFKNDCPNSDSAHCVFVSSMNIQSNTDKSIHYELKGYSFSQNQNLVLPHTKNNMPYNINLKGSRATLKENNMMPSIMLSQGEFDIEGDLNSQNEDIWVGQVATIHDSRSTLTKLEGDYLKALNHEEKEALNQHSNTVNEFQVQTFRVLEGNIPEKLRTVIRVISPKTQTIDLGEVLPQGFLVSQINSSQKVEFANKHYYLWADSGVNYVDISAFSLGQIENIDVAHLINQEMQEFWFFEDGVKSFKTQSYTSIDMTRLEIPPILIHDPNLKSLYQIKLSEPIHISYNEEAKTPQNITVGRDLYKLSEESHFIFKDSLQFSVLEPTFYSQNYDIKAIRGDSGNLIILQNEQKNEGFYPNTAHTEVDGLTQHYQDLNLESANYTEVNVHLPPRYRLITVLGASSPDSYLGSFTLYSLFALFFIVIASYKLFNWKIALIASISILGFAQSTIFIWFFWFSLLFIIGLMNRLEKEGKLYKILKLISLISIVVMTFNVAYFSVYETQKVFNPMMDLSTTLNINRANLTNITGQEKFNELKADVPAPPTPAPMVSSVNSFSEMDKIEKPVAAKPTIELANEKKSLFIDNWDTLNSLSLNYRLIDTENHFQLIYASSFWVNLMGIIQIITIWLMLFAFTYKITHHFYQFNYGQKYYAKLTKWGKTK